MSTLRPISPQPLPPAPQRGSILLLGTYSCAALLAALLIFLVAGYHGVFLSLNHWGNVLPGEFWAGCTVIGDTRVALALLLFYVYRNPQLLPATLLASIPATLIVRSLKHLHSVARPSGALESDQFFQFGELLKSGSFPSGHSTTAGVLFALLILVSPNWRQKVLLFAALLLVALSRVMVGAHWPVDILVGSSVGALSALGAYWLVLRYQLGQSPAIQWLVVAILFYSAISIIFTDSGYPQVYGFSVTLCMSALARYALQQSRTLFSRT